jgi:hypothetical protein
MKKAIPLALVGCAIGLLALVAYPAQSGPEIGLEYARAVPGVPGPLNALKSCTVAIDKNPDGGTDTVACSSSVGYSEIYCENLSSSAVYYGGPTDDLDSVAPAICTDTSKCRDSAFTFSVKRGALGADLLDSDFPDGGTVSLKCTEGR